MLFSDFSDDAFVKMGIETWLEELELAVTLLVLAKLQYYIESWKQSHLSVYDSSR